MELDASYQDHDNNDLRSRIADGDEQAFFALYHEQAPRLRTYILKMSGSRQDTEDILQECFIRAWLNRDLFPGIENVAGWLTTVAARLCLSHLEKMANRGTLRHKIPVGNEPDTPEEVLQVRDIRRVVAQAVRDMPALRQQIYRLSREKGYTPARIATKLGLPTGTIKNHLTLATRQIREALARSGHGILLTLLVFWKIF